MKKKNATDFFRLHSQGNYGELRIASHEIHPLTVASFEPITRKQE